MSGGGQLVDLGLVRALHRAMRRAGGVDAGRERMVRVLMEKRRMSHEVADYAVYQAALYLLDHMHDVDHDEPEDGQP